mmetsp:Transcript_27669/g.64112  ORF Transcript_27669/g.64112 Transcript_27669/m.64112 type:complete len:95 (-) Transcript_27669:309-593(-)
MEWKQLPSSIILASYVRGQEAYHTVVLQAAQTPTTRSTYATSSKENSHNPFFLLKAVVLHGQWHNLQKPSLGIRTFIPAKSSRTHIWHPSRDLK